MTDVFEISDFTTASPLEVFVAELEEVLRDDQNWTQRTVRFSRHAFRVERHSGVDSVVDFPPKAHCVERWFGCSRFLLVAPETDDAVATEDRARLLLSAVAMALSTTGRAVPVFCQLSRRSRRLLAGIGVFGGFRVEYSSAHWNHANKQLRHLSHFCQLFRRKVGHVDADIRLAIRVTYCVNEWPENERQIQELQMAAFWPQIAEQVVIDSDFHSDLEPGNAPKWSLRALFTDWRSSAERALQALTSLRGDVTSLDQTDESRAEARALVCECVLGAEELPEVSGEDLAAKAAPLRALSARIGVAFVRLLRETPPPHLPNAVSGFWRHLVAELRAHWESRRALPHLPETGSPDLQESLFHQKMQFLQKCIHEARAQHEDAFYDCADDAEDDTRRRCRGLSLLRRPSLPLLIPDTQEAPPVTEDMIAEQMAVLQRLGSGADSARIRARLQSASLVSDMSAFKAANGEHAVFEDFVRWHSSRDFDEQTRQLSERFRCEDNVWRELWDASVATPVERQKALFDFTRDAEKALHFLSAQTMASLSLLLEPIVVKVVVADVARRAPRVDACALIREYESRGMEAFVSRLTREERQSARFESLLAQLAPFAADEALAVGMAERLLSEPEVEFSSLSAEAEVTRRLFAQMQRLAFEKQTVGERDGACAPQWPPAKAKEFVLRCSARRPHPWSRDSQQRMYCLVSETETRVCGAFSADTT